MTPDQDTLLPADPLRGLDDAAIEAERDHFDGTFYTYGMRTAEGAARVTAALGRVCAVLDAGLGRDAALATLLGECARLERDGHPEYSDTVVRESIAAYLEPCCAANDVDPFTDDEVAELSLLLAQRGMDGMRAGFLSGLGGH